MKQELGLRACIGLPPGHIFTWLLVDLMAQTLIVDGNSMWLRHHGLCRYSWYHSTSRKWAVDSSNLSESGIDSYKIA